MRKIVLLERKLNAYNGRSITESARIREILTNHDIRHRIKTVSHLGQWAGRGTVRSYTGSAGNNPEQDHQTIIYVQKQDYEKAMHFITSHQGN